MKWDRVGCQLCFAVEVCRLALETIEPKCHKCFGRYRQIRGLLIRHRDDGCLSWIAAYPDTHKDRWFVCCCVSEWKRRGWGSGWATYTDVCVCECVHASMMPWKVVPFFICYSTFRNKETLKSENMIRGEMTSPFNIFYVHVHVQQAKCLKDISPLWTVPVWLIPCCELLREVMLISHMRIYGQILDSVCPFRQSLESCQNRLSAQIILSWEGFADIILPFPTDSESLLNWNSKYWYLWLQILQW